MGNILVDANIFLEVFLEQEKSEQCKKILREIEAGKSAFLSTFTIDAIIIIMGNYKVKPSKIELFINSLFNYDGLQIYSVTLKDRLEALKFMAKYGFDYENSITLQSAISCECDGLVSLDKHFDKVKEVKRIEP